MQRYSSLFPPAHFTIHLHWYRHFVTTESICSKVIACFCQPLSKSISFERGNCAADKLRIITLVGNVAAWPTKIASWRLKPESILVKPDIESGNTLRTCSRSASFVIRSTIHELHCDSTVASTSLGLCETNNKPTPYFRPSFAILRIADCAASCTEP